MPRFNLYGSGRIIPDDNCHGTPIPIRADTIGSSYGFLARSASARSPALAGSSRTFAVNQAWLELALAGIDLLAWTQLLLLEGELTTAEPALVEDRG